MSFSNEILALVYKYVCPTANDPKLSLDLYTKVIPFVTVIFDHTNKVKHKATPDCKSGYTSYTSLTSLVSSKGHIGHCSATTKGLNDDRVNV